MPIDVTCECGHKMRLADDYSSRREQCPACGADLAIKSTSLSPVPSGLIKTEDPDDNRPPYELFSPSAIAVVTFLTGPTSGFLLLFLNYWRLGKQVAAWLTVFCGLAVIAGIMAISLSLPENVPGFVIGLPLFLILWFVAETFQGRAYWTHLQNRGSPASGWSAAGFAVLGLVVYVGVFIAFAVLLSPLTL